MLTTRTAVIEYLVSIGKPRNLATAMTEEFLNYGGSKDDQIYNASTDREPFPYAEGDFNEIDAVTYYDSFISYGVQETDEGIWFDGELLFNKQGYYIHAKGK